MSMEYIEKIPVKPSYSRKELEHYIRSAPGKVKMNCPECVKKGDVFVANASGKARPFVVFKASPTECFAIPLSSSENEYNIVETKSRFFGQGYFGKQIILFKTQFVIDNFVGVYDNMTTLNKAIKVVKAHYKKSLRL